jgi:beta-glucosidase
MPEASYHFPKRFLWGTATSSHQVEGSNSNNNWSAWENEPGRILKDQKAGLASDWWGGRWKEDFDRLAETHQNTHRLSLEWSRIQPVKDKWEDSNLAYYHEMVTGLVQRKIKPMITLHHFTDPLWFSSIGGWGNDNAPELFEMYVRRCVEALKDQTNLWCTINEPNLYALLGYIAGTFPPGRKGDFGALFRIYDNLIKGHALAYRTIHELQPEAQVGLAINRSLLVAGRRLNFADRYITHMANWISGDAFMCPFQTGILKLLGKKVAIPGVRGSLDYFGLNYYYRQILKVAPLVKNGIYSNLSYEDDGEPSPSGKFGNTPRGMFAALTWAKSFGLPIMITENGIEDAEDSLRRRYLLQNLHQVWRAVNFNYPVRAYYHWSLVDNFEWADGWENRFGLWGLDINTQERIRRKSVDLYAAICMENGITTKMVREFSPEIFGKVFPF